MLIEGGHGRRAIAKGPSELRRLICQQSKYAEFATVPQCSKSTHRIQPGTNLHVQSAERICGPRSLLERLSNFDCFDRGMLDALSQCEIASGIALLVLGRAEIGNQQKKIKLATVPLYLRGAAQILILASPTVNSQHAKKYQLTEM